MGNPSSYTLKHHLRTWKNPAAAWGQRPPLTGSVWLTGPEEQRFRAQWQSTSAKRCMTLLVHSWILLRGSMRTSSETLCTLGQSRSTWFSPCSWKTQCDLFQMQWTCFFTTALFLFQSILSHSLFPSALFQLFLTLFCWNTNYKDDKNHWQQGIWLNWLHIAVFNDGWQMKCMPRTRCRVTHWEDVAGKGCAVAENQCSQLCKVIGRQTTCPEEVRIEGKI